MNNPIPRSAQEKYSQYLKPLAGPIFSGSNIITQAIKSLAARASAESNVITLASVSRQR